MEQSDVAQRDKYPVTVNNHEHNTVVYDPMKLHKHEFVNKKPSKAKARGNTILARRFCQYFRNVLVQQVTMAPINSTPCQK
mgnify:CR=1 FL=1